MKKKIFVGGAALAVLVVISLAIAGKVREKKNFQPPASIADIQKAEGFPVRTARPFREEIEAVVSIDGSVKSARNAVVVSREDRRIEKIAADEGDPVREGEVLVVLEKTAVALRTEAGKSAYLEAERNLQRAEALFAAGAISRQELDGVRVESDRRKAAWQESEEELRETELISPLNGFIARRYKEPGELSGAGIPILEIVDLKQVEIVCAVAEHLIPGIREGQKARVSLDAFPEKSWETAVGTINPTASEVSRLFTVKLVLDNPGYLLRPGMYARVVIVREVRSALLLPSETLVQGENGETGIFLAEGDKAVFRPVRAGQVSRGLVEIVQGLDENSSVVVEGQDKLKPGAPIRITGE